jgi:hypothetical protein
MKPYFEINHVAGVLLLIASLAWGAMELGKTNNSRQDGIKIGGGGRQFLILPTMAVATAALYLAPHFVPSAAIRPAAAVFAVGLVVLVGGLVLRGCLGIGLASANWVSVAAMVLLPLAVLCWRIRAEESALAGTVGDRYRAYAAHHKRLVPFVW